MSLKSYKDPTKELFVMVKEKYHGEPVTFFYMVEISQKVAVILPNLLLLLEGRLGMTVSRYFLSSYSIGIDGYKWDDELDKVISTRVCNYLEEIDKH